VLRRYDDEKRVDELPELMKEGPDQAILVEHDAIIAALDTQTAR
jgi:hypothetical protein